MNKLFFISALMILGVACQKEETPTVLRVVTFPGLATSTVSSVTLLATDSTSTNHVIGFSWPAVNYGITANVTYSLYFDVPSDTIGTNPWGKAVKEQIGVGLLSVFYTAKAFNGIALQLGLIPDSISSMVVRVESFVDRSVYSNGLTIKITPYQLYVPPVTYPIGYLYLAGDFQGWNINGAIPLASAVTTNKKFEGYIYIPAGGTYQYKSYTTLGDWNSNSYGDNGDGTTGKLKLANYAGGNFLAPGSGYYEIGINLKDSTWSQTATTWGIIGDATPGGWDTDTQMTYDVANHVWKVTADMKIAGSFKFRANKDWKIDFGIDSKGKLTYADNPFWGYTDGLSNLTVPLDGNYTITLDLSNAGSYTYTAVKN
jgi:starch-binding outer membrane protein SusE/F